MSPAADKPPPATKQSRALSRLAPLAALLAVALAAYWAGLPRMLSPEALGREQTQLHALVAAAPVLTLAAFVLGYAVIVASCIPVALMLSLVGGMVFGRWLGSAAVLLGATGAALLTYAAVRCAFASSLVTRAERDLRLARVIEGFGRNAFSYVLTSRLLPFAPFGLVNIAAGLAAVPVRAYAAATLIGGAPAAVIYAHLGAGLGEALGSSGALHAALGGPRVLLPLAAMALLAAGPLLYKRLRKD